MRIINLTLGKVLAENILVASTFWQRLWGMGGSWRGFPGCYLTPCQGVHTLGYSKALEIIYISAQGQVLFRKTLQPYRLGPWIRKARGVLELPVMEMGTIECRVGDWLEQQGGYGW
jgi:uncharacterized protein